MSHTSRPAYSHFNSGFHEGLIFSSQTDDIFPLEKVGWLALQPPSFISKQCWISFIDLLKMGHDAWNHISPKALIDFVMVFDP